MFNAFELLTDNPDEIADYKARSDMMNTLNDAIQENNWTQKTASVKLGVQPEVITVLATGGISVMPCDTLTAMINKLKEL